MSSRRGKRAKKMPHITCEKCKNTLRYKGRDRNGAESIRLLYSCGKCLREIVLALNKGWIERIEVL